LRGTEGAEREGGREGGREEMEERRREGGDGGEKEAGTVYSVV